MAMIAVGGMLGMAYQKYNKQIMRAMRETADETMKKMDKALDDMM